MGPAQLFSFVLAFFFSAQVSAGPVQKPLLWKAEREGQVAHIFGTMHLGVGLADFPKGVLDLVASSSHFYMEADLRSIDPKELEARSTFPPEQSLDLFLPRDSWAKLLQITAPLVPEEKLKRLKPWFVSVILIRLASSQIDFKGQLDTELLDYARSRSIPLAYLESPHLQFSVLEAVTTVSSLDAQLKAEDPVANSRNALRSVHSCYLSGELDCLAKLFLSKREGGELEDWVLDLLVSQRNRTWIPIIEKAVKSGSPFIAVGAGHLLGQEGILHLLQQEGFRVERISF